MSESTTSLNYFLVDESGASIIEYSLLAALIATVVVATLNDVANPVQDTYNDVRNKVEAAIPAGG